MFSRYFYIVLIFIFTIFFVIVYVFFPKIPSKIEIVEEITKKEIIFTWSIFNPYDLDFLIDDSYQKFVSPNISFENIKYKPNDLILIKSEYIKNIWWNQQIRQEAFLNLDKMAKDFYLEFWIKLNVMSSYRSYEYQAWIKSRWCSDYFCAKAWHSEHQSGLAVDFFEATNNKTFLSKPNLKKYFNWWRENAHKYGYHNTYQRWREIDWYEVEPWHWRYVWVDFATYLLENDMTFAEFFNTLKW